MAGTPSSGCFLDCQETASNDFVLQDWRVELLSSDIADWSITFVATRLESPIGERLRRVRRLLEGEEMFRANYADVLTDALLDAMVAPFAATPDAGVTPWMRWRTDRSNPAAAEVTVPVLGAAAH